MAQPNIVVIMTDQERYAVPYEDEALREFRRTQLKAREEIAQHGFVFHNHHIASAACCPSRASFFTGHMPHLHGVSQTYGFAKNPDDKELFWLEPGVVPTMGNLFSAAGYDCQYRGKWHISYENIVRPDGAICMDEEEYRRRNPLLQYGFSGWTGPEPHGHERELTGAARDEIYTRQVCDFLEARAANATANTKPFLLVASLVNPHDIALTGPLYETYGFALQDETVPPIPPPPTRHENLKGKPRAQEAFRAFYDRNITPARFLRNSPSFYYFLHKRVDACIGKIYDTIKKTCFDNTIVVLTSDHGEMLSAHGGMQGKWHNAYREVVHVPLTISSPLLVPRGDGPVHVSDKALSSHIDLVPTLLDLAGIDAADVLAKVGKTHTEAHAFPGASLKPLLAPQPADAVSRHSVVYLTIEDEITRGEDGYFTFSKLYPVLKPVKGMRRDPVYGVPVHLECIVCWCDDAAVIPSGPSSPHLLKFVRYYDNTKLWTQPDVHDTLDLHEPPELPSRQLVRTTPCADEYEMYDVTVDPLETRNLALSPNYTAMFVYLQKVLAQQRAAKCVDRFGGAPLRPQRHSIQKHHHESPSLRFVAWLVFLETRQGIAQLSFASLVAYLFYRLYRHFSTPSHTKRIASIPQ